jgi:hypothetical protein
MSALINSLRKTTKGDTVTLTVRDTMLTGEVTHYHRTPAESYDGVPVRGSLIVHLELDAETFEAQDYPTESVEVRATERRPGRWEDATATVWDPITDDETIILDDWMILGDLEDVEVA